MQPSMDAQHAVAQLHRLLCLVRVLDACLVRYWASAEIAPLADGLAARLLETALALMQPLLRHEISALPLGAIDAPHSAPITPEAERMRAFSFGWRDTESLRERECEYAMLDVSEAVQSDVASTRAFFVLESTPMPAPIAFPTPADASDAPPLVVAAYLYRSLSRLVYFLSTTNHDMVFGRIRTAITQAPVTHDERRTAAEIRLLECANVHHHDLTKLLPLIGTSLNALGKRPLYAVVCVALRRAIVRATVYHPHETPALESEAYATFDALYSAADSMRRRYLLWPTLAALLSLCPMAHGALLHVRTRLEVHSKKASFLEALQNQLTSPKLGVLASYSLVVCARLLSYRPGKETRALAVSIVSPVATRAMDWARNARLLSLSEARLLSELVATLVFLDCHTVAMQIVQPAVQCSAGALCIIHALYTIASHRRWDDRLSTYAPIFRAHLRTAAHGRERRIWVSALHPLDASLEQAFFYAVLQLAMLEPQILLQGEQGEDLLAVLLRIPPGATFAPLHHITARFLYTHATSEMALALRPSEGALIQSAATRVLQADSYASLWHEVHAMSYLVRRTRPGALDAELMHHTCLAATVYALCMLDMPVHRAAHELAHAIGTHIADPSPHLPLVQIFRTLPRLAPPEVTAEHVCASVRHTPAARVAWNAVLVVWQPFVRQSGNERAMRLYARFLATTADAECTAIVPPLATLVLRGDAAARDTAAILLAKIPSQLVLLTAQRVRETSIPDTRAAAGLWLAMLEVIAARSDLPASAELADMLAQCAERAAPATHPEARVAVCRIVLVLCADEAATARGALALRILPWTDAPQASVRRAAVQALVPLTHGTIVVSDAMDESHADALRRRIALYVHGLLRAVRRSDDATDAETAIKALTQILRTHPTYIQTEAPALVLRAHPAERAALLHACAAIWPVIPAEAGKHEPLLSHDVAHALVCACTSQAPALEEALAGVVDDECALVCSLLGTEIESCTSEDLLLRSNSTRLSVATAYLRRFSYSDIRIIITQIVGHIAALPMVLNAETEQGRVWLLATTDWVIGQLSVTASGTTNLVRRVCAAVRAHTARHFSSRTAPYRALAALMMLRVLGPALATPESIGVKLPERATLRRELVLLSKVLLALAQGGFPKHRDAHLTALNPHLKGPQRDLIAVLDKLCDPDEGMALPVVHRPPLADRAYLYTCLAEHAEAIVQRHPGLANDVHRTLAVLPPPSRELRLQRALHSDATSAYETLMRAHSGRDTSALHRIVYETHIDGRRIVSFVAARLPVGRTDLALLAYHTLHILGSGGPCDMLLDMSLATCANLPPMQWVVYMLSVVPRAVLAQARSLVVLNASTPLRQFLRAWTELEWPGRVVFATSLAEVSPLAPADALPSATYALLQCPPEHEWSVSLHDGRLAPIMATLKVCDSHLVITSTQPVSLGKLSGRTCDIIALNGVYVMVEGSVLVLDEKACTLYVGSSEAPRIGDVVRAAQARRGVVLGAPLRSPPRSPKAVLHGAALWHTAAEQVSARSAAAALLRAAGGENGILPAYTLPHAMPAPPVPSAAYAYAMILTTLDLCAACGSDACVALTYVAPLLARVNHAPHVDLRALFTSALMVWAAIPTLRATLSTGFWAPLQYAPDLYNGLLDACLDVTPMQSASSMLHAVLDALGAVNAPPLHMLLLRRIQQSLQEPLPVWRKVDVLVHLLAVQILTPGTPVQPHLPSLLCFILLLAHRMPFLNEGIARTAHNTLYVLQRETKSTAYALLLPKLAASIAEGEGDHDHATVNDTAGTALTAVACEILALAAPESEPELVRLVADYAARGGVQAQAFRVLSSLHGAGVAEAHLAVQALAEVHRPAVAGAAALCSASLMECIPHMVPALFWAGLAMVQSGDKSLAIPGLYLAQTAAERLPARDADTLLSTRRTSEAYALDAAYGVNADRDLGFALATVLYRPLTAPGTARITQKLLVRLLMLFASPDGSVDSRQTGILLLLCLSDPTNASYYVQAARLAPSVAEAWRAAPQLPSGSAALLAVGLAAALLRYVPSPTLHPLCAYLVRAGEANVACAALLQGPLAVYWAGEDAVSIPALRTLQRQSSNAPGASAQLLSQLGFPALMPHAAPDAPAASAAWLRRLVALL